MDMFLRNTRIPMGNPMTGPITSSTVQKYTNKLQLVEGDKTFLRSVPSSFVPAFNVKWTATSGHSSSGPSVKLERSNRVEITELMQSIGRPMEGRYFLCRTIMPPHMMTSIMTVVDDPEGVLGVRLALYNYTKPFSPDPESVLPVGMILAIKNPWFKPTQDGGLTVRVDSPGNVVILDNKKVREIDPDLKWKGEIPAEFRNRAIKDTSEEKAASSTKSGDKTNQNLGNKCFVDKNYWDAIRFYSLGLAECPNHLDLLSNRAAAFLELRCFRRAQDDTAQLLLQQPNHVKGVYRHVKGLWGLEQYAEAGSFLKSKFGKFKELAKNKDLQKLMQKSEILIKESQTGEYDMTELIRQQKLNVKTLDVAGFKGPVAVEKIPNKGRGLVATQPVEPGQLLICEKAFAIHYDEGVDNAAEDFMFSFDLEKDCINSQGHDELVRLISYKLTSQPETGHELYELHAGKKLKWISRPTKTQTSDLDDPPSVDMKRIHEIVTLNAFSPLQKDNKAIIGERNLSTGLWINASFINHSCVDVNARWEIFGDVLTVRAVRPIAAGEEVVMSYLPPSWSFEQRQRFFDCHEFVCTCSLCKMEEEEDSEVDKKRCGILKDLQRQVELAKTGSELNVHCVLEAVHKLEKLQEKFPKLNFALAHEVFQELGRIMYSRGKAREAMKMLEKCHFVCKDSAFSNLAYRLSINILGCSLVLEDKTAIKKWMDELKHDLRVTYGSVEPMRVVGPDTLKTMKKCGIDFFNE